MKYTAIFDKNTIDELAGNVNRTRLSLDKYKDFTKLQVADIIDNISIKVKIMPITDDGNIFILVLKIFKNVAYLIKNVQITVTTANSMIKYSALKRDFWKL